MYLRIKYIFSIITVASYSPELQGLPWMNSAPRHNLNITNEDNVDEGNMTIFTTDEMRTVMTSIVDSMIAERQQPSPKKVCKLCNFLGR